MELKIAGTNMEITPETQRYVKSKLSKLNRHIPDIIDFKVEISDEKTKSPQSRYLVRVTVHSGVGRTVSHGEERGADVFTAIDKVVDIMTRQLERQKGKLYDKRRGAPARGKFSPAAPPKEARKVVKTKHFIIEPMTLQEAVDEMERLGHNFFLYVDSKTQEARLLYRRNDGNYGLIEPEFQ